MMLHWQSGRRALIPTLIVVLTVAALAPAHAQTEEEMAIYMEMAKPGPHHKMLVDRAGHYKVTNTVTMDPSMPEMKSEGKAEITSILGGRFIQEVNKTPMMGMPWEGRGIFGFNNFTQKHIGTWLDTFGTTMMQFEGHCEDECKKIVMVGHYTDPATKEKKTMKTVTKHMSADKAVTVIYDVVDGKDVQKMEVAYERVSKTATR